MIQIIIQRLLHIMQTIGYPGLGLAMFVESFFAPIPSELILPFAWWLSLLGEMHIVVAIIVASISAYLGSLPFYLLWYRGNKEKILLFVRKFGKYFFISDKDIDQGFALFEKRWSAFVFFGRLIPIVRTVVSFPAGAVKMPFGKFSMLTLGGSTIRSALLIIAWYAFGENYATATIYIEKYQHVVEPIILACIIFWIARKIYKRFFHT